MIDSLAVRPSWIFVLPGDDQRQRDGDERLASTDISAGLKATPRLKKYCRAEERIVGEMFRFQPGLKLDKDGIFTEILMVSSTVCPSQALATTIYLTLTVLKSFFRCRCRAVLPIETE